MSTVQNASFASPLADAKYAKISGNEQFDGLLASLSETSRWTIILTLLAILVAYDQCKEMMPKVMRTSLI
jgi:C-22 sterol desaturase